MDTKVNVYKTVKAFWVSADGVRRYCDVTINRLSSSYISLFLKFVSQSDCSGNLFSCDAFNYSGKVYLNSTEHLLTLKSFIYDNDVLLYGNWHLQDRTGEICIHSRIQKLIIKNINKFQNNFLPPVA